MLASLYVGKDVEVLESGKLVEMCGKPIRMMHITAKRAGTKSGIKRNTHMEIVALNFQRGVQ